MSTSSSEGASGIAGQRGTSYSLESTGSLLFSAPSDASDVQTEITPPTSPAPHEVKMRAPRDVLDASRQHGQVSGPTTQGDATSSRSPKHVHGRARSIVSSPVSDEAGYDADGDADGDRDADADADGAGATASAPTESSRRPTFQRIDTRQQRRVASMLAVRRPSPFPGLGVCVVGTGREGTGWRAGHDRGLDSAEAGMEGDMESGTETVRVSLKRGLVPVVGLFGKGKRTGAGVGAKVECYELRRRVRPSAAPDLDAKTELVGLGIGFPASHPLRARAFTMPVPVSVRRSPSPPAHVTSARAHAHCGTQHERHASEKRSDLKRRERVNLNVKHPPPLAVCAPSPVRLVLRPAFLEVSPSPIECLGDRTSPRGRSGGGERDDGDDDVGPDPPSPESRSRSVLEARVPELDAGDAGAWSTTGTHAVCSAESQRDSRICSSPRWSTSSQVIDVSSSRSEHGLQARG